MARGSDGFGEERYLAYLPFEVALGANISAPASLDVGDGQRIRLEKFEYLYALYAGPFKTPKEAEAYIGELRAAVAWIALKFRVGTKASTTAIPVKLWDEPIPIAPNPNYQFLANVGWESADGYYDSENAHVIPDHKRLIRHEIGRPSVVLGLSVENWSSAMSESLEYPQIGAVVSDANLMLSIDLYAESRALIIPRTKLLSLVIALEALLPDSEIGAEAQKVLDQLRAVTKSARDEKAKLSETWTQLNSLVQRVGDLKREPIGSSMRSFVHAMAEAHPSLGDSSELVKNVSRAYAVRSDLVHNGKADDQDIDQGLAFLSDFVPHLLTELFKSRAGAQ